MTNYTEYNKENIYNKEILEKVYELKLLCNKHRLPMFVSVCVKNDNNESKYVSEMVGSQSNNVILKNDLIPKFVNVLNGFDTIPKQEILEVEI